MADKTKSALTDLNDPDQFRYDVTVINGSGLRVKTGEDWMYLQPEEMLNAELVKEKLAREMAYRGIGKHEIFLHNPDLKIGDLIPEEIVPIHTVTIAVSQERETAKSSISVSETTEDGSEWIAVAAKDQTTTMSLQAGDIVLTITEEALMSNLESWDGGYINVNHEAASEIDDLEILEAKYEEPNLMFRVNEQAASFINGIENSGRSFEVHPLRLGPGNKVLEYAGLGLSVLYSPHKPACNASMGCSGAADIKEESDNKGLVHDLGRRLLNLTKSNSRMNDMPDKLGEEPKTENTMEPDEIAKLISETKDAAKARDQLAEDKIALQSELDDKVSEIVSKDELIAAQTESLKSFEAKEAVEAEKRSEDQWTALKSAIPAGLIHTPEAEAALKSEFKEDAAAFSVKLASWKLEDPTAKSGVDADPAKVARSEATTGVYVPGKGYEG